MKLRTSVRLALLLGWATVLPLAWPAPTLAQYDVSVSADVPPPPLPVYIQPPIPDGGLSLGSWLLVLERIRLFLGSGLLDAAARAWTAVDARLLGLA